MLVPNDAPYVRFGVRYLCVSAAGPSCMADRFCMADAFAVWVISRFNQWSTTCPSNAQECAILSLGKCILKIPCCLLERVVYVAPGISSKEKCHNDHILDAQLLMSRTSMSYRGTIKINTSSFICVDAERVCRVCMHGIRCIPWVIHWVGYVLNMRGV